MGQPLVSYQTKGYFFVYDLLKTVIKALQFYIIDLYVFIQCFIPIL